MSRIILTAPPQQELDEGAMEDWKYWWTMPLLLGASMLAAGLAAPDARADGYISDAEYAYVQTWGPAVICPVIADNPTPAGVVGVGLGVMDDGFSGGDAADIVNEAVLEFCPEHWSLLVATGRMGRGSGVDV